MKGTFTDRVAVVTGAARGIGQAIAAHLRAEGARVIAVDLTGIADGPSAERGQAPMHSLIADLADPAAIVKLGRRVAELEPRVDILINNAGIELNRPFDGITADLFDRVIAVNLRAPLLVSQALAPLFPASGGAIVNISSIHADHAFPDAIPYACSKAGLVALTRNLALELAPRHIRVNAVCPGYIDTPMWDAWLSTVSDPEQLAIHTRDLHPLGRRGTPQDVANAVAYLAGEAAEWVTGTALVIDGGLTIRAHA